MVAGEKLLTSQYMGLVIPHKDKAIELWMLSTEIL